MFLFFSKFWFFSKKSDFFKKMKKSKILEKIEFFSKKMRFFRNFMVVWDKKKLFYHAKA